MRKHAVLFQSYQELDNGVSPDVPLDLLKDRVVRYDMSDADFDRLLSMAVYEGDLAFTSPGMVGVTESGMKNYVQTLQLR